ncbi:MAG: hypothetical protein ABS79_07730 [Planctomycetes bacterium SCN 63-9]|nr:MAG: hypothetical protein ABS79_07730 [Planctomycetes bacterium SCN 63-9]
MIGIHNNDDGTLMTRTIDGQAPAIAPLTTIWGSNKEETGFQVVSSSFADFSSLGAGSKGRGDLLLTLLAGVKQITGATKVLQQRGVEDQAIVTRTRLVAQKPYAAALGLLDVPSFKKSEMIPLPEGVNSFVAFSLNPERLTGLIDMLDPTGGLKTKYAEFTQTLKVSSRVDLEKDLLARLGPKMTFYVSPVKSAAAEDEPLSMQSLFSGGVDLSNLLALSRPYVPEATFVAEVKEPASLGKALDGFIIEINKEIKAKATAFEDAQAAAEPRGRGGRDADFDQPKAKRGGGDRAKDRKAEVAAPKFNLLSSPTNTKKFQLQTPSQAKYRLGPPHFRPMIYMDGKHLVIAASAGSADAAIKALESKEWKPSPEVEKALAGVPENLLGVAVVDSTSSTSALLASFPGTVQAQINTGIALAKTLFPAASAMPAAPAPAPAQAPAFAANPRRSMKDADDEFRPLNGRPDQPIPGTPAATPPPQVVKFQVNPDQLPKSEEVKALLFPSTIAITEDPQGILFTQRSAFPEQIGFQSNALVAGFMMPLIQAARARIKTAPAPAATPQPNVAQPGQDNRPGGRRRRDE